MSKKNLLVIEIIILICGLVVWINVIMENSSVEISKKGSKVEINDEGQVTIESAVNKDWSGWNARLDRVGMNHKENNIYTKFQGGVYTDSMFVAKGGKGRWGFHVFEGFGAEDDKRLTILAGKRPGVADIYYIQPLNDDELEDLYDGEKMGMYHTVRIGADVDGYGVEIGAEETVANTSFVFKKTVDFENVITLGSLNEEPDYIEGGIYYNTANEAFFVAKNGKWNKMVTSDELEEYKVQVDNLTKEIESLKTEISNMKSD